MLGAASVIILRLCLAAGGTPAAYPWDKQARETPSSLLSITTEKFCAHLANCKLPKEKSFHRLCLKLYFKAVLCYRTAGHPAHLSHQMGILPHPTPQRSDTWLPAVACPALALPEAPVPQRSAGCSDARLPPRLPHCPPILAEVQAPGAQQPTTLQQGEGRTCSQAPETGQSDALLGAQKAPRTPSPGLPPWGLMEAPRSRAEPPSCCHMLPKGLYPTTGLLLSLPKSPPPYNQPALLHPTLNFVAKAFTSCFVSPSPVSPLLTSAPKAK